MKAGKITLFILVILIAAVGVAGWWLTSNIDRIARETIVETGSELLGTRVSLDAVEITLREGAALLGGLRVANPPGYPAQPALSMGAIEVDIDLASVREDALVIESVTVRDLRVNFEMNEKGDSNIGALQENVDAGAGAPDPTSEADKLVIDRLEFTGGSISARAALKPDRQLEFGFPELVLTGLGRPDGATADEIGAEISAILMDRIMKAATRAGVDSLVEEQKEKLIEKAEEKLEEKLKDLLKRN